MSNQDGIIVMQDAEAEQAVLGCMLCSASACKAAEQILAASDFVYEVNARVFECACEVARDGFVDAVSVFLRARSKYPPNPDGSTSPDLRYVSDLASNSVVSPSGAEHYAKIIKELSVRRSIIASARASIAKAQDRSEDVDTICDTAIAALSYQASTLVPTDESSSISSATDEMLERVQRIAEAGGGCTGLPSGLTDLDALTTGMHAGELIVIAARPSMGKTALALNMAMHAARDLLLPVAVFSLEMTKAELVTRIASVESRVHSRRIGTGNMSTAEWERFGEACGAIKALPVEIYDRSGQTIQYIRTTARKFGDRYGACGLIVIDYIQLVASGKESSQWQNRAQEVAEISRGLKALAKELQCPVIALSQLNRALEARTDKHPMMADLRESGAIEQDADIIEFIYRPHRYDSSADPTAAEIIVAKQRNGSIGTIDVHFDGAFTRFSDKSKEQP